MDLVKIGKFISERRKLKGYSQVELADKLNISNKTISKWERGNGLPDVSLLLPLCKELDISVNELLCGESISEAEYQERAEDNLISVIGMAKVSPQEKKIMRMLSVHTLFFATAVTVLSMLDYFKSSSQAMIALGLLTLVFIIGVGLVWVTVTLTLKDIK